MTIVGNIFLVLSSDSLNSTGNASVFTQTLGEPFIINSNSNYEVCLVDFECPTPELYTNKPIHITADICGMTDINGSLERLIGRTMLNMPTVLQQNQIKIKNSTQEWFRLEKTTFENISISIKDDSGLLIPGDNGKRSSLTLCIRQVEIY